MGGTGSANLLVSPITSTLQTQQIHSKLLLHLLIYSLFAQTSQANLPPYHPALRALKMDKHSTSATDISAAPKKPKLMIVMGVSGSGKSTIAEQLASSIGATFLDADDYHPQHNVDKMSRGEALTDDDRWPWLKTFGETMAAQPALCVGACSALKRVYRSRLTESAKEPILFVYLNGDRTLLMERMSGRKDHFMPTTLLDSQLNTLEIPDADEYAISIDISGTPEEIIERIKQHI